LWSREVTVSTEEHQADIENRLRNDILVTLKRHGLNYHTNDIGGLLDDLVSDAMHQIDPLLIEVEFHE